ncbi:phosphorylase family protein [Streptosporangium sandarakinum]|uniref:phosphorylase family protein n=1 Tax=Streptosporangium sandarakinum TaxID=1260955 RepID=UPI0033AFACF6
MTALLVCTALGIEARAVRHGLPPGDALVLRTGMGPERAARAAARLPSADALAVAGFGGAVREDLRAGDVLVATEVRFGERALPCPWAPFLAAELARHGLPARTGPLVTCDHVVTGAERGLLAERGALAVDMETWPLAEAAGGLPFAALRVIADTADVRSPWAVPAYGVVAYRVLRRIGPALARWAAHASGADHTTDADHAMDAGSATRAGHATGADHAMDAGRRTGPDADDGSAPREERPFPSSREG